MLDERYSQLAELLYLLVLKELKVRYKRSVLGYLWAVANPFVFALVYWVAFKFIMRVQMLVFQRLVRVLMIMRLCQV